MNNPPASDAGVGVDGAVADGGHQGADASPPSDAGSLMDVGPTPDAGHPNDAGNPTTDAGTPGMGPCPTITGFDHVGQRWTLESNDAYETEYEASYVTTSEIIGITDLGSSKEIRMSYEQQLFGPSYTSSTNGTQTYRCDAEGLKIVSLSFTSVTSASGTTTNTTQDTTYSPPLLTMVWSPAVGQSFSSQSTASSSGTSNGTPYSNSAPISHTSTVLGTANVTVPAGAFAGALEVLVDYGSSQNTVRYADGVGMVADDNSELTSYQ